MKAEADPVTPHPCPSPIGEVGGKFFDVQPVEVGEESFTVQVI